MKLLFFYTILLVSIPIFSQENEDYIDYSKQKEWISKVEKQFVDTEVSTYKFSIEEDFIQKYGSRKQNMA